MKPKTFLALLLLAGTLESVSLVSAQTFPESEILGQAKARMQKYRAGDADLRLVSDDGKPLRMVETFTFDAKTPQPMEIRLN